MRIRTPNVVWESVGIAALFNLSVAQPLYDLLSSNVEFFVARASKPIDVFLLILILSFLLPFILMALVVFLRKVNFKMGMTVYAGIAIVLTALVFIPFLKRLEIFNGLQLIPTVLILSGCIFIRNYHL